MVKKTKNTKIDSVPEEQKVDQNGNVTIDLNKIRSNGIFLMIPAYGGQCFAAFNKSCMQLSAICAIHNIPLKVWYIYNESLVQRARNYCVDEFLRSTFNMIHPDKSETTHYFQHGLFIDTDIEFNAMDVILMAHLQNTNPNYDVVCGPYPKKVVSWEKIKMAVDKGFADEDPNRLDDFVGDYVFNVVSNKDDVVTIKLNEPAEVFEAGTGFMMFRRDTLLKIAEKNPNIKYLPDHSRTANFDGSREIHAFFDCIIDPESKRYLSEDYYFCKLVRAAGMHVWIVPWLRLKHHGYQVFGGSLQALAAIGASASVDASKIKKR